MSQPPFDPYGTPLPPHHHQPHQPPPAFPGAMREVDQAATTVARPAPVTAAFALWLLTALSWPIGTALRTAAEDDRFTGFAPVMTLFGTTCLAIAGLWGAIALLRGSYHARLALCGGALVLSALTVAALLVAAEDDLGPVSWTVIVLRLLLPVAAAACSFLPGTRHYFAGNLG
ncbi:hypothetical protein [Saccharothrix syringae]|uniref:Uncharacterized protein n=1 Tax=Saccharothrix syringae TaxID=103733 RepID=A0A5Q0HCQ1_SACSY|nr:hypothetical protein [Saccharothrix syringae]QFZ23580.1 hypothetical protein EKG83_44590 [Saccharothrix syringae]